MKRSALIPVLVFGLILGGAIAAVPAVAQQPESTRSNAPAAASTASSTDCYTSGSQQDLDECAGSEFSRVDKQLNAVWKRIQEKYADQPVFLKKLTVAQNFWIKFRDAEIDAVYPTKASDNPTVLYGSVYPMCVGMLKARLTRERTAQLKVWLKGIKEGDVCAGSVKKPVELK